MQTEKTLTETGMKYYPCVVETNGVRGKPLAQMINRVANVARIRCGHNKSYFVKFWSTIWACTNAKAVADAVLSKCVILNCARTKVGIPYDVGEGAFLPEIGEGPLTGRCS